MSSSIALWCKTKWLHLKIIKKFWPVGSRQKLHHFYSFGRWFIIWFMFILEELFAEPWKDGVLCECEGIATSNMNELSSRHHTPTFISCWPAHETSRQRQHCAAQPRHCTPLKFPPDHQRVTRTSLFAFTTNIPTPRLQIARPNLHQHGLPIVHMVSRPKFIIILSNAKENPKKERAFFILFFLQFEVLVFFFKRNKTTTKLKILSSKGALESEQMIDVGFLK